MLSRVAFDEAHGPQSPFFPLPTTARRPQSGPLSDGRLSAGCVCWPTKCDVTSFDPYRQHTHTPPCRDGRPWREKYCADHLATHRAAVLLCSPRTISNGPPISHFSPLRRFGLCRLRCSLGPQRLPFRLSPGLLRALANEGRNMQRRTGKSSRLTGLSQWLGGQTNLSLSDANKPSCEPPRQRLPSWASRVAHWQLVAATSLSGCANGLHVKWPPFWPSPIKTAEGEPKKKKNLVFPKWEETSHS